MHDLFDTHCHIFMEPLFRHLSGVLESASAAGLKRLMIPSVSSDNWKVCVELAGLPGLSCALGVHPWWAGDDLVQDELREALVTSRAAAIGEIGLDWKADVPKRQQYEVFETQLEMASKMGIPVILHCRSAFEEMLELLELHKVRGVIHAWSRDYRLMERFLRAGLFISFGGIITRQTAVRARESARVVPLDRYVLETDSPSGWISGVPGGKSEPMHLSVIADEMARIRGVGTEEIRRQAWVNSVALFGESV